MKRLLEYAEKRGNQQRVKYCLDNLGEPREIHDERPNPPSDELWNELRYQERLAQLLDDEMDRIELQQKLEDEEETENDMSSAETGHEVSEGEQQKQSGENGLPSAEFHSTIVKRLRKWRYSTVEPMDRGTMKQRFLLINRAKANTTFDGLLGSSEKTSEQWTCAGMGFSRPPIVYWTESVPRVRNNGDLWAAAWLAAETKCPLIVISSFLDSDCEDNTSRSMTVYHSSARASSKVLRQYYVPMISVGSKQTLSDTVARFVEDIKPKAVVVDFSSRIQPSVEEGTLFPHTPVLLYDEAVDAQNQQTSDKEVFSSHFNSSFLMETMGREMRALLLPRNSSFSAFCNKTLGYCYHRIRRQLRTNTIFSQLQCYAKTLENVAGDRTSVPGSIVDYLRTKVRAFQSLRLLNLDKSTECSFEGSEVECVRSIQKLRRHILSKDKTEWQQSNSVGHIHLYWLSQEMNDDGIRPLMRCTSSGLIDYCFSLQKLLEIHVDSALTQFEGCEDQGSLTRLPSFSLWYRALLYFCILPAYVSKFRHGQVGFSGTEMSPTVVTQERDFLQRLNCEDGMQMPSSKSMHQLIHHGHVHPILVVDLIETIRLDQDLSHRSMLARCALLLRKYKHGPVTLDELHFWEAMIAQCFPLGNRENSTMNDAAGQLREILAFVSGNLELHEGS